MAPTAAFGFGLLILGCLLLLAIGGVSGGPLPPIRVGVFECRSPVPRACFVPHVEVLHAMWFDGVNARGGLLGRRVEAVVVNISAGSTAGEEEMERAARQLVEQQAQFVLLLWPLGNQFWARGMAWLEEHHIPAIAGGATYSSLFPCDQRNAGQVGCEHDNGGGSVQRRRFQFVHSPSNVDEQYFREWIALLRVKRAQTVAIDRVANVFFDAIEESMHKLAQDYQLRVSLSVLVPAEGVRVNGSTAYATTEQLQATAADGVLLLVIDCGPWLEAMQALDYAPPSLASLNCIDDAPVGQARVERNFVSGAAQWDVRLHGSEHTERSIDPWAHYAPESDSRDISSPLLFVRHWQRAYNSSSIPSYAHALVLGSFSMLEAAIFLANSTEGTWSTSSYR